MGRLDGKVAVITGAGSGIGRAAAELFVAEGARVVCVDRNGSEEAVADALGERAVPAHADVSVESDVRDAIAVAEATFGRLDVLFNNAGFGGPRKALHEHDAETWDEVIGVNLKGVFLGMKYGVVAMLRTGGGSIVNTASAAALVGMPQHGLYGAAKAGVVQLTKAAAMDYVTQGIRVNAICPGMTWTGLVPGSADHAVPPAGHPVPPGQPMGRWGLPTEQAAAALFLASDESSFITGVALPVDGGYVCP